MHPLWTFFLEGGPRRVNHSAVIIRNEIFMFGGYCSGEKYETSNWTAIDIFAFNTESLKWRKVQHNVESIDSVPYMRYGHATVAIGEKAYLYGGRNELYGASETLYYFNTDLYCWYTPEVHGHMPGARDGHGMCVARGNIYVFGGFEAGLTLGTMNEILMLDMETMTWNLLRTRCPVNLWRDFHTFTACKDKIYLFGGRGDMYDDDSYSQPYDNDIKVLDLDTLVWSSAAKSDQKLPVGRRSHTAFVNRSCIYIFGGFNFEVNKHYNDLWKFDIDTGLWKEVLTHGSAPCPRRRHCCCCKEDKVYIFGGTSPSPESSLEQDLLDLSDTHVLELESTLKSLSLNVVRDLFKKFCQLDLSCLPLELEYLVKLRRNSDTTTIQNELWFD